MNLLSWPAASSMDCQGPQRSRESIKVAKKRMQIQSHNLLSENLDNLLALNIIYIRYQVKAMSKCPSQNSCKQTIPQNGILPQGESNERKNRGVNKRHQELNRGSLVLLPYCSLLGGGIGWRGHGGLRDDRDRRTKRKRDGPNPTKFCCSKYSKGRLVQTRYSPLSTFFFSLFFTFYLPFFLGRIFDTDVPKLVEL